MAMKNVTDESGEEAEGEVQVYYNSGCGYTITHIRRHH